MTTGAEQSHATAERSEAAEVARDYRWNLGAHLLYGLLGTTRWRLITAPTFVPEYMFRLGGSNVAVGLLLFAGGVGRFLSPLAGAAYVAHRPLVKRTAIVIGSGMRFQVLGMAVTTLFILVGCGQGGMQMASTNLVYEFGVGAGLGVRLAVVNALGELMAAIAPLAGGVIADRWSYEALYGVAIACTLAAAATMCARVRPAIPRSAPAC
jgi:hypothetical protein